MRHKFAKIGIKLWAFFFIIGFGLQMIGKLLKDFADNSLAINPEKYIVLVIGFIIGILLLSFTNKTVKIDTE